MENREQLLELIESSTYITALTGAGISTESGIPDYRTPGKGLWNKVDMSVVSLAGFLEDPSRYYSYSCGLYEIRSKAEPNPAQSHAGAPMRPPLRENGRAPAPG